MQAFRLQNFRGFRDTGWIQIKPLTLLVGANSTGKSSLLRFLPLLRQSMATETGVPFAWAKEGGVDLGTAQDVHRRGAKDPLRVGIKMDLIAQSQLNDKGKDPYFMIPTEYELSLTSRTVAGEPKQIKINAGRFSKTITINSMDGDQDGTLHTSHSSIPIITFKNGAIPVVDVRSFSGIRNIAAILQPIIDPSHGEADAEKLLSTAYRYYSMISPEYLIHVTPVAFIDSLRRTISQYNITSRIPTLNITENQAVLAQDELWNVTIGETLSQLRSALLHWTQAIEYIGPARFPPTRYHRIWADRPKRLMPDGANLAVLFDGMNRRDREVFNSFLHDALGYTLSLKTGTGNAELALTNAEGDSFNIADLGFGLSQVLPVYLQAHLAKHNKSLARSGGSLFVVEQPELHLHPQFQATLADLFVGMSARSKNNTNPVPCFVETHSKVLLERTGELVEQGAIPAEDVQVLLFEKDGKDCTVRATTFDAQGILRNWPAGFLSR